MLLLTAIFLTRKAHNFTISLSSSQFLPPFFRGQHYAFVWLARLGKSSWPVFFVSAVRSTFIYPVYIFKILKLNFKVLQRQLFCLCFCFAVRVIPEIQRLGVACDCAQCHILGVKYWAFVLSANSGKSFKPVFFLSAIKSLFIYPINLAC